ncbi:MAG TPA: TIGR01458 family HAD-type hydrolase [Thermoanaerobaculia bacterium]
MKPLAGVRALLVDLEGTVYESGRLVPGAAEALRALDARNIAYCFVTNTTSRPRSTIVRELAEMGLPVDPSRVFTAPLAAREYLLSRGLRRCHFLLRATLLEDFEGIEPVEESPDAVVIGDLGDAMSYSRLNRAFRFLLEGGELVTLARNRYWRAEEGLMLDVGAFAAALEFASGRKATLVGKPASVFYDAALASLGAAPLEAAVIGDDLESDVGGGQAAGMRGILVRTGKHRPEELEGSAIRPDAILDSISDLARLL